MSALADVLAAHHLIPRSGPHPGAPGDALKQTNETGLQTFDRSQDQETFCIVLSENK